MDIKYINTIGFNVFSDDLSKISLRQEKIKIINTISPNSYGISTKDRKFEKALKETDYLVLDGVYFGLASIFLNHRLIKANQGPDVFYHFYNRLNDIGGKAFFLGSSQKTLDKIKRKSNINFSNITVNTFSPPFKKKFSSSDNTIMVNQINKLNPDILFIGMTCPKQEKWIYANKNKLKPMLVITIGNVFDWFAGTQKSISPIWFKLKLGWLIRIIYRPEIFKRNIINQLIFFWHLTLFILKFRRYD